MHGMWQGDDLAQVLGKKLGSSAVLFATLSIGCGKVSQTFASNQLETNMTNTFQFDTVVLAVLIASLMPVICAGIAKWGRKDYDNHHPRAWYASLDGFAARANAAQQNCFEAFPFFAVGVLLAALSGVEGDTLEAVSWLFIAARVVYVACYLNDKASWRSISWLVGFASVVYLYALAL